MQIYIYVYILYIYMYISEVRRVRKFLPPPEQFLPLPPLEHIFAHFLVPDNTNNTQYITIILYTYLYSIGFTLLPCDKMKFRFLRKHFSALMSLLHALKSGLLSLQARQSCCQVQIMSDQSKKVVTLSFARSLVT